MAKTKKFTPPTRVLQGCQPHSNLSYCESCNDERLKPVWEVLTPEIPIFTGSDTDDGSTSVVQLACGRHVRSLLAAIRRELKSFNENQKRAQKGAATRKKNKKPGQ